MADEPNSPTPAKAARHAAAPDTPPPETGPETAFEPTEPLKMAGVEFDADSDTAKPYTAQTFKDGAAKLTQDVGNRARSYAEDGKARAGGALDELAQMLSDAAGTVDAKLGAQYGQYARTAAESVSTFSESLKSREIDDIIADARGFVQKSPAIAIGAAAAIGFVLVRLLKSGLDGPNDKA